MNARAISSAADAAREGYAWRAGCTRIAPTEATIRSFITSVSRRVVRVTVSVGLAALVLGFVIALTDSLLEGEMEALDRAILVAIARLRVGAVNAAAVDVTALGSPAIVLLFSFIGVVLLAAVRDRRGAIQLVLATTGAGAISEATKRIIERPRPEVVPRLIDAHGFAYPSGHSLVAAALYLTVALVASSHLPAARGRIMGIAGILVTSVALSRVYVGVHFPTDVASGICIGVGWALLLHAGFSLVEPATATAARSAAAPPTGR